MPANILIVDDNLEILQFIEEIFSDNYHVEKAMNGKQALELLGKISVQLIICDIMMPEMDGLEFCRIIKKDFDHCHIPVILLTAKNTLIAKIEGLEQGADAYIEKPFSPRYLKAQVANLISNRLTLKEYFANSPLTRIKAIANSKTDEIFLERLNDLIILHMDNLQLDGNFLADSLHMSRTSLYRKISAISNLTIHELIILTRLKKAAELLSLGTYKIFEVSNITGFSSPSHFNRTFAKQFNMTPTVFMRLHANGSSRTQ